MTPNEAKIEAETPEQIAESAVKPLSSGDWHEIRFWGYTIPFFGESAEKSRDDYLPGLRKIVADDIRAQRQIGARDQAVVMMNLIEAKMAKTEKMNSEYANGKSQALIGVRDGLAEFLDKLKEMEHRQQPVAKPKRELM